MDDVKIKEVRINRFLPISILLLSFFIFKLTNLGVRLSDSNIYFYTGYKLLQGEFLYKDILFTNFPLLPYISAIYYLLTAGNINLFFLIPAIEVSIIGFLIYTIVYKKHRDIFLALTSSALYLLSFIVLSTSDHQSGVFIASLFAILSYYFYLNKKYLLMGIFVSLSLLTKAYFLPILLTFLAVFIFEKKWKQTLSFLTGAGAVGFIILLPTLIFAFPDFIKDVFIYSLTRAQGVEKSGIAWFFITHDFPFFILLVFNLVMVKKNKFFGLLSIFGIIFFFFYQDVYYLYLNFLIPFLALSYPGFSIILEKNFGLQKFIAPTILFCFLIFSFITYSIGFRNLQKINNFSEIAEYIKKENPNAIYGVNDITPALSYASSVPLLNNIIDTNANIYRKGFLSSKKLTADAISQKAILVTHGINYPDAGINEEVTDEIFDKSQVKKSCKLFKSYPIQMEGVENRLNLLRCY